MERIPTNPTSEDLDLALARILSEPSRAALLAEETARQMETEATFLVVNLHVLDDACATAAAHVLAGLPEIVADEAADRAGTIMPEPQPGETGADYAVRLRAAARGL